MALNKEQQECLDKLSTEGIRFRYGQPMASNIFHNLPDELVTEEFRLAVMKKNGHYLLFVPEKLRTAELCLEAVKTSEHALQYVPVALKTAELCLEAMKHHGRALEYVPEILKTESLCITAMQHGHAHAFVPERLQSRVNAMLQADGKITTIEQALAEVRQQGTMLGCVPENLITAEMCLEAVRQDGQALKYVPENLMTAELCLEAVKQDSETLKYVPKNLMSAEFCLNMVKQEGAMLEYVPVKLRTAEFCLNAVKHHGEALEYVPWRQLKLTESEKAELCLEAMKNNGYALQHVPEKLKTAEPCLEAVKQDGWAIRYVPEKLRTAEIYFETIKQHNEMMKKHNQSLQEGNDDSMEKEIEDLRNEIERVFVMMPEELREEVRRRLENEGEWVPLRQTKINIGALTQEAIRFEFDKLSEKELNSVPLNAPYRNFAVISDFVTDKIKVFVNIPDHREIPKSITLKFTNIGKTAEQQEAVINCSGRFIKIGLEGIVILHATVGRPRDGHKYRQKAEITLNFENRCEPLICPISRTTTFNMCFFDAYEAQCGKFSSFGTIYEFSDNEGA